MTCRKLPSPSHLCSPDRQTESCGEEQSPGVCWRPHPKASHVILSRGRPGNQYASRRKMITKRRCCSLKNPLKRKIAVDISPSPSPRPGLPEVHPKVLSGLNFLPIVPFISRLILSANTFAWLKYYSSNTLAPVAGIRYSSNTFIGEELGKYCLLIPAIPPELINIFWRSWNFLAMNFGKIAELHRQFLANSRPRPSATRARPAKVSRAILLHAPNRQEKCPVNWTPFTIARGRLPVRMPDWTFSC